MLSKLLIERELNGKNGRLKRFAHQQEFFKRGDVFSIHNIVYPGSIRYWHHFQNRFVFSTLEPNQITFLDLDSKKILWQFQWYEPALLWDNSVRLLKCLDADTVLVSSGFNVYLIRNGQLVLEFFEHHAEKFAKNCKLQHGHLISALDSALTVKDLLTGGKRYHSFQTNVSAVCSNSRYYLAISKKSWEPVIEVAGYDFSSNSLFSFDLVIDKPYLDVYQACLNEAGELVLAIGRDAHVKKLEICIVSLSDKKVVQEYSLTTEDQGYFSSLQIRGHFIAFYVSHPCRSVNGFLINTKTRSLSHLFEVPGLIHEIEFHLSNHHVTFLVPEALPILQANGQYGYGKLRSKVFSLSTQTCIGGSPYNYTDPSTASAYSCDDGRILLIDDVESSQTNQGCLYIEQFTDSPAKPDASSLTMRV